MQVVVAEAFFMEPFSPFQVLLFSYRVWHDSVLQRKKWMFCELWRIGADHVDMAGFDVLRIQHPHAASNVETPVTALSNYHGVRQ